MPNSQPPLRSFGQGWSRYRHNKLLALRWSGNPTDASASYKWSANDCCRKNQNPEFFSFYRSHPLACRSRSTDVSYEKNFFFPFCSRTVFDLSVTRHCSSITTVTLLSDCKSIAPYSFIFVSSFDELLGWLIANLVPLGEAG